MAPSRRAMLTSAAGAGLGLLLAPRVARASDVPASELKFVFVFNSGGWDPTRVLAPEFDNPNVDMEVDDAGVASVGNVSWVEHGRRPSVSAFMKAWASRMAIFNGVLGRSIAHDVCARITLTGGTATGAADWPTLLAAGQADRCMLPSLVISGPSFAGSLGGLSARAGNQGQLQALATGDILSWSERRIRAPSAAAMELMDAAARERAASRLATAAPGQDADLIAAVSLSLERAAQTKSVGDQIRFTSSGTLPDQAALAANALSTGISRCAVMDFPNHVFPYSVFYWDSHLDNDTNQSPLWEGLFIGLTELMATLGTTPGTYAPTLAEETVVVVMSEMGRTPQLNGSLGKDHWPHNSAFLIAPWEIGRVVGKFSDDFGGRNVDPDTGEVDDAGIGLGSDVIGATLLAMGDVDPAEHLPGVSPIQALLR